MQSRSIPPEIPASWDTPPMFLDVLIDHCIVLFVGHLLTPGYASRWVASPPHLYTPGAILIATWYMLASHAVIFLDYGLLRSFIPTSHISGLHVWSAVLGRVMSGCLLSKRSCFHVGCNNTMWSEPTPEHCRDNRDGRWCLYSFDTSVCSILR